ARRLETRNMLAQDAGQFIGGQGRYVVGHGEAAPFRRLRVRGHLARSRRIKAAVFRPYGRRSAQSSRTIFTLAVTWSLNCWYIPTIIASVGLMFFSAVSKH